MYAVEQKLALHNNLKIHSKNLSGCIYLTNQHVSKLQTIRPPIFKRLIGGSLRSTVDLRLYIFLN